MKLPTSGHFWLFGHFRVGTNLFHHLVHQNSTNPDPAFLNRMFFETMCTSPKDEFETYVKNNLDKTLVYKVHAHYDRLKSVMEYYPHVKIFQYRKSIRDQLLSFKAASLMQKWHWWDFAEKEVFYDLDASEWLEQNTHKLKEENLDDNFVESIYFDWIRFIDRYELLKNNKNTYLIQLEELQSNPQKYFTNTSTLGVPSPTMIRENTTISISDDYTMKFKEIVVRAKSLGLDVKDEF